ncbi:leucine-rich repeat receptor protein kinase HPCA1-like [Apium graveolens]|uniref:leucine-rich repeat receptor protein kinase HPCA1-like n=1 Tax=Apium graveolens TaxID=4045 RepID=UPI003D7BB97A
MGPRFKVWMLVICIQICVISAVTNPNDLAALNALKSSWKKLPPNWKGVDPCNSSWVGVVCNNTRVTILKLAGMGLVGTSLTDVTSLSELVRLDLSNNKGLKANLPASIGNLKKLDTLMLLGCSLFGQIPDSIGSLQNLIYIGLNSNSFTGPIPHSIGNLSKLSWLDLSDNKLNGSLPVSSEIEPGLDLLLKARHFHFSKNQLSGDIQTQLFSSKMQLLHVVLDENNFTGRIPNTLGLVKTLKTVRLDRNRLTGPVPETLSNLANVNELFLSNNNLDGPFPNLTGMPSLNYLDLSNNSFNPGDVPTWVPNLQNLTTLLLENTQLQGEIPSDLFGLRRLETVVLSNNNLSGTLDIGSGYNSNLTLILDNNSITGFQQGAQYNLNLTLDDNPICRGTGARGNYCTKIQLFVPSSSCFPVVCSSDNVNGINCRRVNTDLKPYTGTINFFAFSFSDLGSSIYYESLAQSIMSAFSISNLPVNSVSLCDSFIDQSSHLQVKIQVFPSGGNSFNRTGVIDVGNTLNRQLFPLGAYFGPFAFIHDIYEFPGENKSSNAGLIVGATIGSLVFVLLICAGLYTFVMKKRVKEATRNSSPFASWNADNRSGGVPQLQGAKWISFEELQKCTNNFSDESVIGSGGYGKVYKGQLTSGEVVAIKRAQQGSLQGAHEFKTEIELLSRIHHKNVVSLVGFCYEQGEQILIYEFISNGTLKQNLSGELRIRLEWMQRIKITLDSARGLAYMHELANPPIIHRDIKSTNILLDDKLNAKVADFGISKPVSDVAKGYITTQVKGTMGYMDPEYYMTNQLTEKSDVYSFGIVMLELVTARAPIQNNKHIAGEVKAALGNFQNILDVKLGLASSLGGLEKYVTLAMKCVKETGAERPTMSEVVREMENIMQLATPDLDTESYSTSSIHDTGGDQDLYHPYDDDAFDRSRTSVPFGTEVR